MPTPARRVYSTAVNEDGYQARESPPCALCGGDAFTDELRDVRDLLFYKPGAFTLARCQGCGLVATRPRPAPDALARYYERTYERAFARRFQVDSPLGRLIPRWRLAAVRKALPLGPEDRLLDVGCGYGAFLKAARDMTGCQATGVEQDPHNLARAADPGPITYKKGFFDDVELEPGAYTVVSFLECLEHLPDPRGALVRAHGLLAPGGHVVIEVPDYGGGWRRVFGRSWLNLLIPQHLTHFEKASLRALVEGTGFEVVRHHSLFFPGEGTASLMLWLRRALGLPPRAERSGGQRLLALAAFLGVAVFGLVVEVPAQLLLRALGLAGTQLLIARKVG